MNFLPCVGSRGHTFSLILINSFPIKPWFLHVCSISLLKTLWEKEKIAHDEQFLFFLQCFLPIAKTFCHFSSNLKFSSANSFSLEESKNLSFGKGLNLVRPRGCDLHPCSFYPNPKQPIFGSDRIDRICI